MCFRRGERRRQRWAIQQVTKAHGMIDQGGVRRIAVMPIFGLDDVARDAHAEKPPGIRRPVVRAGVEQIAPIENDRTLARCHLYQGEQVIERITFAI